VLKVRFGFNLVAGANRESNGLNFVLLSLEAFSMGIYVNNYITYKLYYVKTSFFLLFYIELKGLREEYNLNLIRLSLIL
jgi:hypothetical protein